MKQQPETPRFRLDGKRSDVDNDNASKSLNQTLSKAVNIPKHIRQMMNKIKQLLYSDTFCYCIFHFEIKTKKETCF